MNCLFEFVESKKLGSIECNVSFKKLTSLHIGGECQYLFYPSTVDNLNKFMDFIRENSIPYFIIGNGTNLLINDIYFEGVVISLKNLNHYEVINDHLLMIEAGASSMKVIREITKMGIGGLEFMATIPGTIGGMIYGNAGAYKKNIQDVLLCIDYLDIDGKIKCLHKDELGFKYRFSNLKNQKGIILRGYFYVDRKADLELIDFYMDIKKSTQPLNTKNAGSAFRNTNSYHAWEIIDKIEYRGKGVGDAIVSKMHANFLINQNNATFNDMITLIQNIKKKAKVQENVNLILEWDVIWDF